jgi:hypothetical protein
MAKSSPARGDFELGEEHANPRALKKAKDFASEASTIEKELEDLDQRTSLLNKRFQWIKTQGIPEALKQAGISQFTGLDGRSVEVEDFVAGTLPKEEPARSQAIALLESYGLGSIVRTTVVVDFAKEDREEAVKLYKQLRKNNSYNITMEENVHHSSYVSNLKARLEDGKPLDAKALNIFVGYTTKFKKPKKDKRK